MARKRGILRKEIKRLTSMLALTNQNQMSTTLVKQEAQINPLRLTKPQRKATKRNNKVNLEETRAMLETSNQTKASLNLQGLEQGQSPTAKADKASQTEGLTIPETVTFPTLVMNITRKDHLSKTEIWFQPHLIVNQKSGKGPSK